MIQGWELSVVAEAEVVPGPPRRIRDLCAERTLANGEELTILPSELLAILDESETPQ